jgi:acetyltransferase
MTAAGAGAVARLGPRLWRVTDRSGEAYALRTLTPADAPALMRAFAEQAPEDREMRTLSRMPKLPERMARAFCTVDEARDVSLALFPESDPGRLVGGARVMRDRRGEGGEFAVSVASHLKGRGLGRLALETAIEAAAEIGIARVWGSILAKNEGMRGLARKLGMAERRDPDDATLIIAERPTSGA